MPRRRALGDVLTRYDDRFERVPPPAERLARFFDTVHPEALKAIVRGLLGSLPAARRYDVEYYLGVNQRAFSDAEQLRKPHVVDRQIESGEWQQHEESRPAHIERIVKALATGGLHLRKTPDRCEPMVLLRHLHLIEQRLTAMPKGFQRRKEWLRRTLPELFADLEAHGCTTDHRARKRYDTKLDEWASPGGALPLTEVLLTYHHRLPPHATHRTLTRVYRTLVTELCNPSGPTPPAAPQASAKKKPRS